MMIKQIVFVIFISYLIGSFSPSFFLIKLIKNKDIRDFGSSNAGTTNVLRCFGPKIGILVFIIDAFKGIFSVIISRIICPEYGLYFSTVFTVIGHNWPFYLNYKGGKGIATSLGIILLIKPVLASIGILLFIITVLLTKYVSAGSMVFLISTFVLVLINVSDKLLILTLFCITILGIIRHKKNIKLIMENKENKIGGK